MEVKELQYLNFHEINSNAETVFLKTKKTFHLAYKIISNNNSVNKYTEQINYVFKA